MGGWSEGQPWDDKMVKYMNTLRCTECPAAAKCSIEFSHVTWKINEFYLLFIRLLVLYLFRCYTVCTTLISSLFSSLLGIFKDLL